MASVTQVGLSRFPTEESKRVLATVKQVQGVLGRAREWSEIPGTAKVDTAKLRMWIDECRILARSAARPPALGVFGESQVGKSFLISRFSGDKEKGVLVRDPEMDKKNALSPGKPWAEDYKSLGGLSFLHWVNTENKQESTGIISRFTQYPTDQPLEDDCFVGRVLSHKDLLLSLAMGFLLDYKLKEDPEAFTEFLVVDRDYLLRCPTEPAGTELDSLESAWRVLKSQYSDKSYIVALERLGYSSLINQMANRREQPSGEGWSKLAGMLWGGAKNQSMTKLYMKILQVLREMDFADILEIPSDVVCKKPGVHNPITDVLLLEQLFEERGDAAKIFYRKDGDTSNNSLTLTRQVISALIAELTFPVIRSLKQDIVSVLDLADVLDFPGARAPKTQFQLGDEASEKQAVVSAFRRGKLTRLFAALTEQREITALVLAASGNAEAPAVVQQLLENWMGIQRRGETEASELQAAPLFVAVTKSDVLVNKRLGENYASCPLNAMLDSIKKAYATGSGDQRWMDNWGGKNRCFMDVHFVHNPEPQYKINQGPSEQEHLGKRRQAYLQSPLVQHHVSEAEAKWEDLLANSGINLLARRLGEKLATARKFQRLAGETYSIVRQLAAFLRAEYRSDDKAQAQRDAREEAIADLKAIEDLLKPGFRNALSLVLEMLALEPNIVSEVLDRLDREVGTEVEGQEIILSFDLFYERLLSAWAKSVGEHYQAMKSEGLLTKLEMDTVQSIQKNWRILMKKEPMQERMREQVASYFSALQGVDSFRMPIIRASCWVWNREVVELGEKVELSPTPTPPPDLSAERKESWRWILEHWKKYLPDIYVRNVSEAGPPPPGNEVLGQIIQDCEKVEGQFGRMRV